MVLVAVIARSSLPGLNFRLVNVVGVRLALEFLELFTLLPLAMCSLSLLSIMSCMME